MLAERLETGPLLRLGLEGSRAQSTPIVQLGLGGNRASFRTSRAVAEWLERPGCALEHLRMAWNELAASPPDCT